MLRRPVQPRMLVSVALHLSGSLETLLIAIYMNNRPELWVSHIPSLEF